MVTSEEALKIPSNEGEETVEEEQGVEGSLLERCSLPICLAESFVPQ